MAKILTHVTLMLEGDSVNPSVAAFHYGVGDDVDPEIRKSGTYNVSTPNFTQSVDAFWDAAITQIKTNEGIV